MRNFVLTAIFPVLLLVAGTAGYTLIEHWTPFDALYMTVTTLTTVGFGEIHPMSSSGRLFTIFLIMGGVFTVFYAATTVIAAVSSGKLGKLLRRRRMEKDLSALSNHVVVCGFGRMGRRICHEFARLKVPFVVVERESHLIDEFSVGNGVALHGDATNDEVLRRAGIERARALITVVASDSDNLYITMSARLLNDKLFILSRAEDEGAEAKLTRAGASRVVSPYAITSYQVAHSIVKPAVVEFIELAMGSQHLDLQMEEVRLQPRSRLVGQSLAESKLGQELGVIVVAIKKASGKMVYNPPNEDKMGPEDVLIAIGHPRQLEKLEAIAQTTP